MAEAQAGSLCYRAETAIMNKVFQSTTELGRGDCMRAAVASMFELEIVQVPHFILFKDRWFPSYSSFLNFLGYEILLFEYDLLPTRKNLINGCIMASVKSRTYDGINHAVLINSVGRVIHDPNPNKLWLGENVIKGDELIFWDVIEKKKVSFK